MSASTPGRTWAKVWEARALDRSKGSTLAQLMTADGLDTGFGDVGEEHWRQFVHRTAEALRLGERSEVFEVGCGAGAFLYELDAGGHTVSGLDSSNTLIDYARAAIPRGRFEVAEAAALDVAEQADAVVSCGVFLYFSSLDYAAAVIRRMAAKARRVVAVLDLPDAATRDEALACRRGTLGAAAYDERYAGLDHLFFSRAWVAEEFRRCGLTDVRIDSQAIDGYQNGAFRFNAVGFK